MSMPWSTLQNLNFGAFGDDACDVPLLCVCPHCCQAKKAADAKRLEDLFNNSSIDDPEDDLGDKRELLP